MSITPALRRSLAGATVLGLCFWSNPPAVHAADSYWTNNAGGTFSSAGKWDPGVPGPGDNARFTNDASYTVNWSADAANANAFFNGNPTATRTITINTTTWSLTNSLVIDSQSANNIKILHESGTVVVTNASGTASLVVGQNPSGSSTYQIGDTTIGATVIVDRLFVTNGTANSILTMHNGTLTTLHGSIINYAGNTFIVDGQQANYLMTWNILGGSNTITCAQTTLGNNGGTHGVMLVDGPNTVLTDSGSLLLGNATAQGDLTVTNGAHVSVGGSMFIAHSGATGHATVTGSNSILNVAGHILLGWITSSGNTLTIADGAQVSDAFGYIGYANGFSNTAIVTGSGSVWSNSLQIRLGESGPATDNLLIVSNGARAVTAEGINVAVDPASSGRIVVTGQGSLLQSTHGSIGLNVGSNATTKGSGSVLLTDGGMYEGPSLVSGFSGSGTISNVGGIFQFLSSAPTITANTAGSILLTNGTISFRGITDAPTTGLAGITYQGDNTLRLNNSTNATGLTAYSFDSAANTGNPTNYQSLQLINGSSWRSGSLTIGSSGSMLISNSATRINAAFTSTGTVRVVNSTATFASNVVISGGFISDPSTITFLTNVTVTEAGYLQGGARDVFNFQKNLIVNSTNNSLFDLASSTVSFSGGGVHTNAVTGGDFGTNLTVYPNANFSYGTLTLASATDQLYFVSGGFTNGLAGSNALYVTQLNLFNNGVLDSSLVTHLHSPFNIYYLNLENNSGNTYLNDTIFGLDGGGRLMPFVPEPSSAGLMLLALGVGPFTGFVGALQTIQSKKTVPSMDGHHQVRYAGAG